jgi:sec-independent protein translocase protein TatB
LNRIRRGFNDIKREVEQELHNDSVMQELRKTGQQLKSDTEAIGHDLKNSTESLAPPQPNQTSTVEQATDTAEKNAE